MHRLHFEIDLASGSGRFGDAHGPVKQAGTLRIMTREHKLALVVGFGLILIVGILISDHFSTTARLATADLSTTNRWSFSEQKQTETTDA